MIGALALSSLALQSIVLVLVTFGMISILLVTGTLLGAALILKNTVLCWYIRVCAIAFFLMAFVLDFFVSS
jgi:hypothetical protein